MISNTRFAIAPSRSAQRRLGRKICLAFAAAALMLPASRSAHADTDSYSIDIASSLQLLESPSNASVQKQVSEQSALVDRVANNNPVLELTNTSTTSDITNVQLTLNDPESVIEALKVLSTDGTATGAFATNVYGGPATTVDISLSTPLAPGQSLLWAMELAPVKGYADTGWTPGYENILFPGSNPIPGTNASFTVTYTDPMNSDPTTSTTVLPDLATFDPTVTVEPTAICSSSCGSSIGTATTLYTLGVPTTTTNPSVPEPSSVVLLVVGCLPLVVRAWRKRQRAVRAAADFA
jgi:hypothetical protein